MTRFSWWLFYGSWLIALGGFFLSIYFGEVAHFEPCRLCWYQRMALFPLVLLLGLGVYRSDPRVISYALPFALFGAFVASYHALQESFPLLQTTALCGEKGDCSEPIFLILGYFTFPMISALGFLSMTAMLFFLQRKQSLAQKSF